MLGYPDPVDEHLSREQARALDDDFFSSDPLGYLHARIASVLNTPADPPVSDLDSLRRLGLDPALLASVAPTKDDYRIQAAVEAFAVRHHAAELLVRLTAAVFRWNEGDRRKSLWMEIVDGPLSSIKDVEKVRGRWPQNLTGVLITEEQRKGIEGGLTDFENVDGGIRNSRDWILYAANILASSGLDANAAHNRIKHGFALRPRTDLRVEIAVASPSDDPDTIPFTTEDLRPVVDAPSIQVLDRVKGWASADANGSVEMTVLSLRRDVLAAEALILSNIYGAVFASAASAHFMGRPDQTLPRHPGLIVGPSPAVLEQRSVAGYRVPLALSKTGNARPVALSLHGVMLHIRVGEKRRVRVQDDGSFAVEPEREE